MSTTEENQEIGRLGSGTYPLVIGIEDGQVTLGSPTAWWTLDAEHRQQLEDLLAKADHELGWGPCAYPLACPEGPDPHFRGPKCDRPWPTTASGTKRKD